MQRRYNAFGSYVRGAFGSPVFKVNIDAGFTCPNRDGTVGRGGCSYCNNESFKPEECRPALSVGEQVKNGIRYLSGRYGADRFIAYFQAYTNTYAPVDELRRLYREALSEPSVVGLAIGTRPDSVDAEKLDMLAELARDRFVLLEYGVQSTYEKSLEYMNRGHDYSKFLWAVAETRKRGLMAGGHMIVGFPSETEDETLRSASIISGSGIGFLKIHQLQVVKGTPMARQYEREPFNVFGYDEYIRFLVSFIERLSPDIVLQRLFATAPDEILIAPKWGRSRHEILRDIEAMLERLDTRQGRLYKAYTAIS
jgi:radical SAM protein (TIGR01212 family)